MFPFREFLRRGTGALHRRVDDAFSRFDLSIEPGIRDFLTAQAAALLPIERALEEAREGGPELVLADWASRRRSFLLDGLGLEVPRLSVEPCLGKEPMLGMLYVLEGSKLGGRFLLDRMITTGGPFGRAATSFLGHDAAPGRWSSFLRALDHHAPRPYGDAALDGARRAFELFETAARIVDGRGNQASGALGRRGAALR